MEERPRRSENWENDDEEENRDNDMYHHLQFVLNENNIIVVTIRITNKFGKCF